MAFVILILCAQDVGPLIKIGELFSHYSHLAHSPRAPGQLHLSGDVVYRIDPE